MDPVPLSESMEWRRKAIHVATGLAAAWVLAVAQPWRTLGLLAAAILALLLDLVRHLVPSARQGLQRRLPGVYRETETAALSGATYLVLGYTAATALFPAPAAAAGVLALALGDTAAAVAGRAWRRRRAAPGDRKTLAGSSACLVVAAAAVLLVVGPHWAAVLLGGLVAALGERFAPAGLDNLIVPVLTGAAVELALGGAV